MKQKFIENTYLKHVLSSDTKLTVDNDEMFAVVKHIKKVEKKFMASSSLCLIDDGYFMLEVIPKKKNYLIRAFFNDKKELLEYYIDIIKSSGIDEKTKLPYYMDLFLDLVVTGDNIEVWDEDELDEAYNTSLITKEDYELAKSTTKSLIKEIKQKNNKYMNMNLSELL
jgi:predicted RNA-binding protein associated with RNAse of E/G family